MSDLTSKTVEELRESNRRSHSYDGLRTVESCVPQSVFDELARRLEEAQQEWSLAQAQIAQVTIELSKAQHRSEAHDAEVAAKALEELAPLAKYLHDSLFERIAEYRAEFKPAGR